MVARVDRTQSAGGASLGERLRGYPAFTPLHLGGKLSSAQAEANLAQFVAAVPERLRIVVAFLQQQQLDARPALAQNDPRTFLNALWDWGRPRWTATPQPKGGVRFWRESRRDGEDILLSLLSDTGVLLGEIIRAFRPEYHWAIVEGREERAMSYYRQPVLKIDAPRPECEPSYHVFDLIDLAVYHCTEPEWPAAVYGNQLACAVDSIVLGGYEWAWKGFTIVPPMQSWESYLASRPVGKP